MDIALLLELKINKLRDLSSNSLKTKSETIYSNLLSLLYKYGACCPAV